MPYAALYPGFVAATETLRAREPGPEAVAQVVLAALRAQWPRARYTAAVPLATRVAAILPDWGKDLVMRRMYRLGSYRPGQRAGP